MTQRTDRVDELLRQEIGSILSREVKDPRIGFATVTKVETTPDLRHAKVWVSVIGGRVERRETIAALGRAMPFVRHELGGRLRIRRIPDLHVQLDETTERGTRILHLIDELEAGRTPDDVGLGDGESLPTPVVRLRHEGDLVDEPPSAAPPPGPVRRRPRRPATDATGAGRTQGQGGRAKGQGGGAKGRATDSGLGHPGKPTRPSGGRRPKR
jgi:ribosome-binding factor A